MKQITVLTLTLFCLGLAACSKSSKSDPMTLKDMSAENKTSECPNFAGYFCPVSDSSKGDNIGQKCIQRNLVLDKITGKLVINESKADGKYDGAFEVEIDGKVNSYPGTAEGKSIVVSTQAFCTNNKLTRTVVASDLGGLSETYSTSDDGQTLTVETLGIGKGHRFTNTSTYTWQHD